MNELVFAYPSVIWDDFSIHKEMLENDFYLYRTSMEGYIYYKTLQDAIDYLTEIKQALEKTIETTSEDSCISECIFRSYDIEVVEDVNGVMVFLNAPALGSVNEVYNWLKGVINQLKEI